MAAQRYPKALALDRRHREGIDQLAPRPVIERRGGNGQGHSEAELRLASTLTLGIVWFTAKHEQTQSPGDLGNANWHAESRPAGEDLGRTARIYVPEGSDSGIVPMNHSDSAGKPWAENEERGSLIKEHIPAPNTHPTQSVARTQPKRPCWASPRLNLRRPSDEGCGWSPPVL